MSPFSEVTPENFSGINEEKLIALIQTHRIISQTREELVPLVDNQTGQKLNEIYKANKFEQLKLSAALIQIHKSFVSEHIDLISFKGPTLSLELYGDSSERTSRDLDFLIRKEQLDKAIDALQKMGYELQTRFSSPKQKEAIIRYYHHMELYHPKEDVLVELHWKLSSSKSFSFNADALWGNKRTISFSGQELHVLDMDLFIAYLCLHGALHSFFRLQWLTDLSHIIGKMSEAELEATHERLRQNGTSQFLCITLALLKELFALNIPDKLLNNLDRRSRKVVQLSLNRISENTSPDIKASRSKTTWRNHQIQYYTGGFKGLMKSIFARNVRPKNWQLFAFPDSVFFLNHLFSRFIWFIGKFRSDKP